ncbi:MAG: hypothetical protein EBV06_15905 [Planctomycetia bacterium]|nr:hypothetical protein [Planctomycetia bacterium]
MIRIVSGSLPLMVVLAVMIGGTAVANGQATDVSGYSGSCTELSQHKSTYTNTSRTTTSVTKQNIHTAGIAVQMAGNDDHFSVLTCSVITYSARTDLVKKGFFSFLKKVFNFVVAVAKFILAVADLICDPLDPSKWIAVRSTWHDVEDAWDEL